MVALTFKYIQCHLLAYFVAYFILFFHFFEQGLLKDVHRPPCFRKLLSLYSLTDFYPLFSPDKFKMDKVASGKKSWEATTFCGGAWSPGSAEK